MKKVLTGLIPFFVLACESAPEKQPTAATPVVQEKDKLDLAGIIPEERKEVKKEAVASYQVQTDDPLNDFYFSVSLFETKKTFHYLMKLEFETIDGKDTLRLPNFGTAPEPVIKKGPEKYSAIIGFLDKEKQFREYKKVYVVGNKLKVIVLKHYSVTATQP